ncbi:TIGR02611 family protein [Cryobacterium adonitolivorans]|uniref:TIGR02611 family protein n=1 Tax=Cryobacterium adonitolivorans TaxID=1259189 RepID=A0A4R8W7T4_9MICO|nr:TIGR02611 family protein [Cryobacterium adonitolivorans]TFC01857.1 TIGR02611 family protein [Cryobacterium adonitolivorans]
MSTSVSRSDAAATPGPVATSDGLWSRIRALLRRSRAWIHRHPRLRAPYRVLVALAGLAVIVVGLILVPLPGPGWLIVFVGVAILGTEFPAAHRLTRVVRRLAHRVRLWWRARQQRQSSRAYS